MQNLNEILSGWLGRVDPALAIVTAYLSGAAGWIGILAYAPPILLSLLTRQAFHILAVCVLQLVTLAIFHLDDPTLGLFLYTASYLIAAHGFAARQQQLRTELAAAQVTHMRDEITTFLSALDRRSREADHAPPKSVEPHARDTARGSA